MVLTNPAEGREDEFNDWYDNQHLAEVVAVPGFISARRYQISPAQLTGFGGGTHRYLAVYWIEGDAEASMTELAARLQDGTIDNPPCLNPDDIVCLTFSAIAPMVFGAAPPSAALKVATP